MVSKAPITTYGTDWAKLKGWAAAQKIPTAAVNNVQTLDASRMQSGYQQMSQSERVRAIQAAAGQTYVTPLPTDKPQASNIIGNTISNIRGIATGLMPTRLVSNIFDTLKNSVEDLTQPGHLKKEGGLEGALTNSILSWVPGAYDLGTFLKAGGGMKGLKALETQPVTSVLDVMPAIKWLDTSAGAMAAATSTGETLATRLGIGAKALGQMGAVRMMGKAIGSIELPGGVKGETLDAAGNSVIKRKTLSERMSQSALNHGMGKLISGAAHGLMSIGNKYSLEYKRITKDMFKAVGALSKDKYDAAGNLVSEGELTQFNKILRSGASIRDVMDNPEIPVSIKWAVKQYQPWEQWHQEYMLRTNRALRVPIKEQDGTVHYAIYESTDPVHNLVQAADDAQAKADEANLEADHINDQATARDEAWAPVQGRMGHLKETLRGIPAMMERAGNPMNAAQAAVFGALLAKGGLLDQMEEALAHKDFRTYKRVAKKAQQTLNTATVRGVKGETAPARVGGKTIAKVKDASTAHARIPSGKIRFFRPDGPGDGWSTNYHEARRAGGTVYRVDVPESEAAKFFAAGNPAMADQMLSQMRDYQRGNPEAKAKAMQSSLHHQKGTFGKIEHKVTRAEQPGWDTVPMLAELKNLIEEANHHADQRLELQKQYIRKFVGTAKNSENSVQGLTVAAAKAQQEMLDWVRRNPPGMYRDAVLNAFFKNFLASARAAELLPASAEYLKAHGYDKETIDRMERTNPQRLYELVAAVADPTFRDPFLPAMTKNDHEFFMKSALDEVNTLRATGHEPMYVPRVGAKFSTAGHLLDDRIYVNPTKYPTVSASFERSMDMSSTVYDVMLGVSKATKEILGRHATLEFVDQVLKPMLRKKSSLFPAVSREHIAQIEQDTMGPPVAVTDALVSQHYGLVPFNVKELLSPLNKDGEYALEHHDLGLDDNEEYYLPANLKDQVEKLVGRDQFPLHGAWDKTTGVFKYSILGLSPRYTAHILFGGTMLLALRINPASFLMMRDAARAVRSYHKGETQSIVPDEVFQGAAQRGSPDPQQTVAWMGGKAMGRLNLEEWLSRKGINPKLATPVQKAAALADINFRFTNYISDMQRAIAYLDGAKRATGKGWFRDSTTGEKVDMTSDRAHWEGMQAAERVMGNLQAMTPLERTVARKVMPFYGWTKHILKYVLTYPVDHPWRTMFLATLATQNSDNFSKGLDERMQLLFFLGQPDVKGNVSAVDVRALDPFRDVANYATLGGWISAMNPMISAPFAAVDPQIIYGSNELHPNITYDAIYGTNVAGAQGTPMQAAEAEIPELSVLDQALGLTAKARSVAKSGGEAKALYQALNIPFAQVQHLNLQQISAKHEIDRYEQAKNDALQAWQTGDFSRLLTYPGTVPDPLNAAYNITPADLKKQYERALKAYPKLPPSETVASLPTPPL